MRFSEERRKRNARNDSFYEIKGEFSNESNSVTRSASYGSRNRRA